MMESQRNRFEPAGRKTAVVFLTPAGAGLAERLADAWSGEEEVDLYSPEGSLAELVRKIWNHYDSLVFIMAVGIVVRVIAPLLRSKWSDPGVVAVDEKGSFAVSLVSGHWGRANDLARRVAAALGALPVVTTATDVQGRPAIDLLARECGFCPLPPERVKLVNKAFLRGDRVIVFTEWDLAPVDREGWFEFVPWTGDADIAVASDCIPVFVTSRVLAPLPGRGLYLCPPSLVAGVGCRRGVSAGEVLDAVEFALKLAGRRRESLRLLASHIVKENERGLRDAALSLNIGTAFFDSDLLQDVMEGNSGLQESGFVKSHLGVGGVCEPAALAAARDGRLVLPKTCFGRVTVALAEDGLLLSASGRAIRRI